jgi:pyruvyl transferase EpsO
VLTPADTAHLERLQDRTRRLLESVIGRGREVVYLGTPRHRNLGDSLIWAGALGYLADLGNPVVYHTDQGRFRDDDLRSVPGDAAILLHGGGNLGDLYPAEEEFRRHVVRSFPHREFVVLPQSVHYRSREEAGRAHADYSRGRNLTVLLRDRASMETMADIMPGVARVSCPDLALRAPIAPTGPDGSGPVVVVARHDGEARAIDTGSGWSDWTYGRADSLLWFVAVAEGRLYTRVPSALRILARPEMQRANGRLLRANLAAAALQYRGARAVATNRLHAHILACLTGVPNVVADNTYGKISHIFGDYTGGFSTARQAGSLGAAVRIASSDYRTWGVHGRGGGCLG